MSADPLIAAIQLTPRLGDVPANLARAGQQLEAAGRAGAEVIVLPEFFTTGMAFEPRLRHQALPLEGAATELMLDAARRHGALVGGSFLRRDHGQETRNTFVLVGADGVLGWHDKDLPTMWEGCFYEGGSDPGIIETPIGRVGVALCWELIRSATARRLAGEIDLLLSGSAWWSVPPWRPRWLWERARLRNATTAERAPSRMARLLGVPVAHAGLIGPLECRMPTTPISYRGRYESHAGVFDARGDAVDRRSPHDPDGIAIGSIELPARPANTEIPSRYWLCRRGWPAVGAWHYQGAHGRLWRRRHHPREEAAANMPALR